MEEEKKYFEVIGADNVRTLTTELNSRGLTKDDIAASFFNPGKEAYYVLVYV